MIVVLCGGVGAARLLAGLVQVVDPASITAIVNTADDLVMHGLSISPDLDTIVYTLADATDPVRGWGLRDESWHALEALERFQATRPIGSSAGTTWFRLGDRDLATHMYRTHRLAEGATLTTVTAELATAWGLGLRLLPVTDDPIRTLVTIAASDTEMHREVSFQDYFVRLRHDVAVTAVRFAGANAARPTDAALDAIRDADTLIIAPSNPIVSIGPLLAVPGIEDALRRRRREVIAVSPLIGGRALKGPADRLMAELGSTSDNEGVARAYCGIASTLVIDEIDAGDAAAITSLGMHAVVTPTIMSTPERAAALASTILEHRPL